MWVFCINLDGPFNHRRFQCGDFEKSSHLSSTTKWIKLDGRSNPKSSKKNRRAVNMLLEGSQMNISPVLPTSTPTFTPLPTPTLVAGNMDMPPCWAHPGLHSESSRDVVWAKSGLSGQRVQFTMYLSQYFSKHASVEQGFQELIELFSWRDIKGADGRLMKVPPEATTYRV